jgi:very-short-patch-repair endonuclease
LINKNLKNKKDWIYFYEYNLNDLKDIPKNPQILYKENGWTSWAIWLNITYSSSDKIEMKIEDLICIINENKIQSREEYIKLSKSIRIPTDPLSKFKLKSWSDILCKKEKRKRGNYFTYEESKIIVKNLNLKSQKEWYELCKKNQIPEKIPKTPNKYYEEWISWNDWLDHKVTSYKKFISYKDAKEYLSNIGITSLQEYFDHLIECKIDFLPLQPHSFYGREYKSIDDFLSIEFSKTSYGEKKIIKFLDKNNIKYNHQYKFDDCFYINKLIFDFYLPNQNICLEFDGKQHFEPIKIFGGVEAFEKLKLRDKIKNEYCIEKGIKMIRISYEDINIIDKILEENLL